MAFFIKLTSSKPQLRKPQLFLQNRSFAFSTKFVPSVTGKETGSHFVFVRR
jgi:hypothetical protein